jgi:hypothetical protein
MKDTHSAVRLEEEEFIAVTKDLFDLSLSDNRNNELDEFPPRTKWSVMRRFNLQNSPLRGGFCFSITLPRIWLGCAMAYYKARIEVWCDWNPAERGALQISF